jgi:hypothetical protein
MCAIAGRKDCAQIFLAVVVVAPVLAGTQACPLGFLNYAMNKREIMMRFRHVLSTAGALLAVTAFTLETSAAEMRKNHRHKITRRAPVQFTYGGYSSYGGYYGQIGGYRYSPGPERNEFKSGSAYNYPGHYNNQSFWERVQTQRNFPVQY